MKEKYEKGVRFSSILINLTYNVNNGSFMT